MMALEAPLVVPQYIAAQAVMHVSMALWREDSLFGHEPYVEWIDLDATYQLCMRLENRLAQPIFTATIYEGNPLGKWWELTRIPMEQVKQAHPIEDDAFHDPHFIHGTVTDKGNLVVTKGRNRNAPR